MEKTSTAFYPFAYPENDPPPTKYYVHLKNALAKYEILKDYDWKVSDRPSRFAIQICVGEAEDGPGEPYSFKDIYPIDETIEFKMQRLTSMKVSSDS